MYNIVVNQLLELNRFPYRQKANTYIIWLYVEMLNEKVSYYFRYVLLHNEKRTKDQVYGAS